MVIVKDDEKLGHDVLIGSCEIPFPLDFVNNEHLLKNGDDKDAGKFVVRKLTDIQDDAKNLVNNIDDISQLVKMIGKMQKAMKELEEEKAKRAEK